ncbi:MAG TPA: MMPL family transporter [Solirubrobacteraceae bacterium]|nr:MMPL family transporter [Solirubrobacteraceae bacterium]
MNASRLLSALAGGAGRRPRLVLALALVLGVGGAALAVRLRPTAATNTLVSSSSADYQATQRYYREFGEEPVVVLVKGNLQQLVLSSDLERLLGLEGCLSGNVPVKALADEGGLNGPCGQLARAKTVKVVFGPGTFLNEAAEQIDKQLAGASSTANAQAKQAEALVLRAALARGMSAAQAHALAAQARKVSLAGFQSSLVTLALKYGLTQAPSIEDANFVSNVVFDSTKPAGTPKSRFAYLFPSRNAALVSVRMKAGLSEAQRNRTIALIRQAVRMPQWQLTHGESYLVTGEPVIVADLTSAISHSIELLLIAVLVLMAATLGLVFSGRPRLLPLALALLAAAITFGALSAVGASLTMASIAVLPVLVGLAVDYSIQFQARVQEASTAASSSEVDGDASAEAAAGPGGRDALGAHDVAVPIERAAAAGAPTLATAAAASAAAMLVLLLSPVPMVRGFGVLLIVGVAIALVCALTAGAAAISLSARAAARARHASPRRRVLAAAPAGALHGVLAVAWRGAREVLADNPLTRAFTRVALEGAVRNPTRVLAAGLALAVLGWGLDTQTSVQTDITKLVPQNLGSLQNLNTVERITGVGGEIELLVEGRNLTKLSSIEWMVAYQKAILARFGYSAARGCQHARLCPAFSLPDLLEQQGSGAAKLSQAEIDGLLGVIPAYFSQDVITSDRHVATLAFGIRLMSLSRQQQLIEQMRARLHPPPGIHASLVGLSVLAAQSGSQVASPWRRLETLLAGLLAVALVLLVVFRGDRRRALVPLVPIVLASGWSALILFAVRVPLNPMSVTLGALVIAISTEFSVLLSERHRQERMAGHDTVQALRRSYRRTGAAVAASGVTAIVGFGVLSLSDIAMLRDFGLVTLIDLSVSLVGVLVALPATLVLAASVPHRPATGQGDAAAHERRGRAAHVGRRVRQAWVRS